MTVAPRKAETVSETPGDASLPAEGLWRRLLADAIRDPDELWRVLDLPPAALADARAAHGDFAVLVPRGFAASMRPGDLDDPLLRQVLPLGAERADVAGFVADPLREAEACAAPGLLQKYHGRALLVAGGACAVHCRYCFRRHYPYQALPRGRSWWAPALARVAADPSIEELILSGGDPLILPDAVLARIAADAAAIPHLRRLRVHSRVPVVLPERVDPGLLRWLASLPLQAVLVLHANHPAEISPSVASACRRLRAVGVLLLNQSVLLRGVNDAATTLEGLSRALLAAGVLPYYLHLLDAVAGAAHFAVDEAEAVPLLRALQARLPGYLVPRLVREEPGAPGKVAIA